MTSHVYCSFNALTRVSIHLDHARVPCTVSGRAGPPAVQKDGAEKMREDSASEHLMLHPTS